MNLKEAFRFMNRLQVFIGEASSILELDRNTMRTTSTYLRHKVMTEAQDEVVEDTPYTEFADNITDMAHFLMELLENKGALAYAISKAKRELPMDFDSEASLNTVRRQVLDVFKHMANLRGSETVNVNGGLGYRFNTDGNQVSYKCDVKKVTTINFDRKTIRRFVTDLSKEADDISTQLDLALINTSVDYTPPFDVNDTFAEVFLKYCEDCPDKEGEEE